MTSDWETFLGRPVRRVEDEHLLRGKGGYIANMHIEGGVELAFVRSTLPHALIEDIDITEATDMPGVVGVYAASDLGLSAAAGPAHELCARHPLAVDRVRFVGELVAVVAAETADEAVDATERVVVRYSPLPSVADPEEALRADAPVLFERIGTNHVSGLRSEIEALADAEVVVRGVFRNQRLAVVPMESGVIAVFPQPPDAEHDLVVYAGVQMPHTTWGQVAREAGLPVDRVRLIAPEMGGGFGGKTWGAEHQVAVGVARRLNRPARWVSTRSENMVSMAHGRGQIQYVELGLRRDGTITGMHTRIIGDGGAYGGSGGLTPMGTTRACGQGPYDIPRLAWEVAVAVTNTTPTGAYRGAGRPEAAAQLERIVDMAAVELGIDPAEMRRRNFLRPEHFPVTTHTGSCYDSGDYEKALDEALRLADYERLRERQAEQRTSRASRVLGVGIASYVESSAPAIADFGSEFASVSVGAGGRVTVSVGTSAHGQGHATTFAMVAADLLRIPLEEVDFVQADTAVIPRGGGTVGSRSAQLAGSAVLQASQLLIDRARELVADHLEAAMEDIELRVDGVIGVSGSPAHSMTWSEIAALAAERGMTLVVDHVFDQGAASFSFGTHVAVVEVDLETGLVCLVQHVAVDDCGTQINPMLVEGQVHGGVASGVAQALYEHFQYADDGTPLTTTLMEYLVPSAAELPSFLLGRSETPSPLNPLGAKGIGESGATGSTAAVQNAVVDALSHLGVRHIDMPCSPERVWRAIREARRGVDGNRWKDPIEFFPPAPDGLLKMEVQ